MSATYSESEMMGLALEEAALALSEREVPVGCVFASPCPATAGAWLAPLARAHNRTNASYSPLQHAEMVGLNALVAGLPAGSEPCLERLRQLLAGATLFVTVEPCIMCADALAKAGVRHVVYGCPNDKFGGCGTVARVFPGSSGGGSSSSSSSGAAAAGGEGASCTVRSGVRASEAVALLKQFYARSNDRAVAAKVAQGP